jgi:hypothetical protein
LPVSRNHARIWWDFINLSRYQHVNLTLHQYDAVGRHRAGVHLRVFYLARAQNNVRMIGANNSKHLTKTSNQIDAAKFT